MHSKCASESLACRFCHPWIHKFRRMFGGCHHLMFGMFERFTKRNIAAMSICRHEFLNKSSLWINRIRVKAVSNCELCKLWPGSPRVWSYLFTTSPVHAASAQRRGSWNACNTCILKNTAGNWSQRFFGHGTLAFFQPGKTCNYAKLVKIMQSG